MPEDKKVIAIYPGTFDPITLGHLDIIKRSSKMYDKLIVGVLNNTLQAKEPLFDTNERVAMIKSVTKDIPNVEVKSFAGLLVDFAKEEDAKVIVRGIRAVSDYEYEFQMAQVNRSMLKELDTVFLCTDLKYSCISSSIVKDIASYGGRIEEFLPDEIIPKVKEKYKQ